MILNAILGGLRVLKWQYLDHVWSSPAEKFLPRSAENLGAPGPSYTSLYHIFHYNEKQRRAGV